MRRGLVRTTLTTNFDPCLPIARDALRPHLASQSEVNRTAGDFDEFDLYSRAQIVWLHGRAEGYTDKNLVDEVRNLDPELKTRLRPLLEDSPLVVVGYRGAEPSITRDLLLGAASEARGFRKGIYWCVREGETLHENVVELQAKLGGNFVPLTITGFDELMNELSDALIDEDLYLTRNTASSPTGDEFTFGVDREGGFAACGFRELLHIMPAGPAPLHGAQPEEDVADRAIACICAVRDRVEPTRLVQRHALHQARRQVARVAKPDGGPWLDIDNRRRGALVVAMDEQIDHKLD